MKVLASGGHRYTLAQPAPRLSSRQAYRVAEGDTHLHRVLHPHSGYPARHQTPDCGRPRRVRHLQPHRHERRDDPRGAGDGDTGRLLPKLPQKVV
ncbi:MAG: hypothetical protein WKG07_32200 [Hymenobacter sp.]